MVSHTLYMSNLITCHVVKKENRAEQHIVVSGGENIQPIFFDMHLDDYNQKQSQNSEAVRNRWRFII